MAPPFIDGGIISNFADTATDSPHGVETIVDKVAEIIAERHRQRAVCHLDNATERSSRRQKSRDASARHAPFHRQVTFCT